MTTVYPEGIDVFSTKVDRGVVYHTDINNMQDAIVALETFGQTSVQGVFNVKSAEFGGIGDGVADDTAAFDAMIDAARAATAANPQFTPVMVVPPGVYLVGDLDLTRANLADPFSRFALIGAGGTLSQLKAKPGTTTLLDVGTHAADFSYYTSGTTIGGLYLNGNNTGCDLMKIGNLVYSRLYDMKFENTTGNAVYIRRAQDTTFDRMIINLCGAAGSGNGSLVIDTYNVHGSHLYFNELSMEIGTGRAIEFLQTAPATGNTYQVVFTGLKVEGFHSTTVDDYPIYLDHCDHVKFINGMTSAPALAGGDGTQNGYIYVGADALDVVFDDCWFYNNAGVGDTTQIEAYAYINNNALGVRFANCHFRQNASKQAYCIQTAGTTTNVEVLNPTFYNWTFPVGGTNVAFTNDFDKVSITQGRGGTQVDGPPLDTIEHPFSSDYKRVVRGSLGVTGAITGPTILNLAAGGVSALTEITGFIMVTVVGGATSAIFELRGGGNLVAEIADSANNFGSAAGASNYNIYYSGGYKLQNNTGGADNFQVLYFGRLS